MKNKFLHGAAALALCAGVVSCSEYDAGLTDSVTGLTAEQMATVKEYTANFVERYGEMDPNHTWGFGDLDVLETRAIEVNGDVYDKFPSKADVEANFPTSIPADAVEVDKLLDTYKGKTVSTQYGPTTLWDIYAVYNHVVTEGFNLKITKTGEFELGGNYQNAGWNGSANVAYPYNVYVNVDGNVTIKRNGATHFNLYILKGNVTLGADYGEQAGLISVAEGATLNDARNSIAANQGVKIYNKGTINATNTEKYDIGNFCTVYNEGTFNVAGALTYSPGDANTSYFVNFGDDAKLTAASMTLNSAGNFLNQGIVEIEGETNVTQANIYWVNGGHYTTGSMVFSAKNATFYNYCQLLVKGNAHMYDGEFNLMTGSYTEVATAGFDNFIVNMRSNSGFNVKGDSKWEAQGDGTYQGFRTSGSNVYVRLGGTTTVAAHKLSLELTGNITYAINNLVDLGASNDGVKPTYRFNEGTVEAPFASLTPTYSEKDCGATWTPGGDKPKIVERTTAARRVLCEDLGDTYDFDFNDLVFDVYYAYDYDETTNTRVGEYRAHVTVRAIGGTLPIYIGGLDTKELHEEIGGEKSANGLYPVEIDLKDRAISRIIKTGNSSNPDDIDIYVINGGTNEATTTLKLPKTQGKYGDGTEKAPQKICMPVPTTDPTVRNWPYEHEQIETVYKTFRDWVQHPDLHPTWWLDSDAWKDIE